jgi:hypothetical protein
MDEIPGWILRAIAGNGHDVDWSGRYCAYAIETVSTTLYPVEAIESFAASALVVQAILWPGINDSHVQATADILSATVYGEAFGYDEGHVQATADILSATLFDGYPMFTEPDHFAVAQIPLGGELINGVTFDVLEQFAADAIVTGANMT